MEANQWQELCEWTGFTRKVIPVPFKNPTEIEIWVYPDGKEMIDDDIEPAQDMNTLFRWMWPKLTQSQRLLVFASVQNKLVWLDTDPFEALAQAIYKVVENGSQSNR